jgi:hypothetical protein
MKLLIAGMGIFLACPAVWAHHSFEAEFDDKKPVTLEGAVTEMEWVNPHSWIHLDVKNPDGTVTNWAVEGNTPNMLIRKGFTKDALKPGTEIVVQGYQAKRGGPIANGSSITFKDGRKLFMGSAHEQEQDKK